MTVEIEVHGVRELVAALERLHGKVDPVTGKTLSAAAIPVRSEARRLAEPFSARTASGIRIRRKGTLVRVEQGQRKTTGAHSSYGGFQQRNFFDPALADNADEVITLLEAAMTDLAGRV